MSRQDVIGAAGVIPARPGWLVIHLPVVRSPRLAELIRDVSRTFASVPNCGATGRAKVGRNRPRRAVISLKGLLKVRGAGR